MKKARNIFVFVLVLLLAGCSSSLKVTNVNNAFVAEENAQIYALPKNVVRVKVEVTQTIERRGPYYQFAAKYLGTNDVVKQDQTKWQISNITVETHTTPDYNHFYVVESSGKEKPDYQFLYESGYIMPFRAGLSTPEETHAFLRSETPPAFDDLTMKDNLAEREKTVYETIKNDSTSYKVMKKEKYYSSRTIEEKAEEAAHNLIRLRKRRFKLLAGIEKNYLGGQPRAFRKAFPDGKAMEVMVQELGTLESEIEALFKGKTSEQKFCRTFEYSPGSSSVNEYELFSFSYSKGILPRTSNDGIPVYLSIKKYGHVDFLKNMVRYDPKQEISYAGIVYRLPDKAAVSLSMDGDLLARKQVEIAQFGTLVTVPFLKQQK